MIAALRRLFAILTLLALAACGGGGGGGGGGSGGSGSGSSPGGGSTPAPTLSNYATVSIDRGPAAVGQGSDGYIADNIAYVSVTLCVPGTSTCQTIDHIQIDTGSVGLRIVNAALSANLRSALPKSKDAAGNPVGECYSFVAGYVFGSVRQADFKIGGETVAAMPFQLIGDGGQFASVPASCSAGGGNSLTTVKDIAANGILGIGTTTTDCGPYCATPGGYAAAVYYDCPASGCAGIAARAARTTAPFEQLPNPVAAMPVDNNGSVLVLPAPADGGSPTLTGTLYFGIGTQNNNGLGAATVLTTTTEASAQGPGFLVANYGGRALPFSFVDSGSNANFFVDSTIAQCSDASAQGFYCPSPPLALAASLTGANGATADASFTLRNAQSLFASNNTALPGIGANPQALDDFDPYSDSFDFGLPFFFGRSVFTAIEGRAAGGATGPFVAY